MALSDTDVIFMFVYGLLIVVNLVGNTIVCWVVKRCNHMRTPMNYLLVNLAISDIVMGIFQIPRHFMYEFYEHPQGVVGDILCKFFTYGNISWVGSGAGVFTLLAIAWERYNAIMKPLSRLFSLKQIKAAIVLSWVFGVLVTSYETVVLVYSAKIKSCEYHWNIESGAIIDSAVWLIAGSLLPSTVMIVLYGGVIKTLWFSKNNDNVSQRSLLKSRKRVTKSVITVTAILFVCWTPNLSYYFANACRPSNSSTAESLITNVPILFKISKALILLNSTVNPFVYAIQDVRFRRCMKRIVSCSNRVEISPVSQATIHKGQ